jgi:hypothetical protein
MTTVVASTTAVVNRAVGNHRRLIQRVRESGQWELGPFGVIAYPWRLGLHKGVAITIDLRRSLSRVIFGYAAE